MDNLNKLAAKLAEQSIFLHMSIGAIVTSLLVLTGMISSQEDVRSIIALSSIPFAIFYVLKTKKCVIFYGEEKYKSIMPYVGRTLGIPSKDPHFYENMNSDISSGRKRAGFIYVLSKFITCFYIGGISTIGVFSINYLK